MCPQYLAIISIALYSCYYTVLEGQGKQFMRAKNMFIIHCNIMNMVTNQSLALYMYVVYAYM